MTNAPAITALAPWFGSKRTLAPRIVAALGPHAAYWEPFCGSMAVLLAKPRATMETVNDLHGDLINLARVIRDPFDGPRLYRRLRRTLCVDDLIEQAKMELKTETDPFERAFWYFIDSWLGRNGCAGTQSSNNGFCIRFTAGGGSPSVRLESAVASIPAWRRRLRRVVIVRKDAMWLLSRIADAERTVIYCDPPYLVKGCNYVHDFESDGDAESLHGDDHARLAGLLGRFTKTRVVVSYYDHPRLATLYPADRWEKIDCATTKALVNQGMRDKAGATVAPEVLLVNRSSQEPSPRAASPARARGVSEPSAPSAASALKGVDA